MKPLSDILPAMKSPEDLQKAQSRGLTPTGGHAITITRHAPLTEGQLTEIASLTLRGLPRITFEKRTKYGRKEIDGYYHDNEPIGEETVPALHVDFRDDCPMPMLRAALAMSPPEASVRHITRLAIHKKFGSNDADRRILIADYVDALAEFPEFVVYLVCRNFWENDRRPFIPFIDEIKEACRLLFAAFETKRNPPPALESNKMPTTRMADCYADPRENPIRRELCDWLVGAGKPDYFDQTRLWSNYDLKRQVEHEKRKQEEAAEQKVA